MTLTKERIKRFNRIWKKIDKDCPMHDCIRYEPDLRGGCLMGTKRRNCQFYEKKCPRCNGTGDDSVKIFSKSELKYAGPHVCSFCGGEGTI